LKLGGQEAYQTVTVIVPTYNSAKTIETCIESVNSQTYPSLQVIIIDSRSTDGTVEIAGKMRGVTILQTERLRSAARNLGVAKAQGEFLLFIDSDMELTSDVVRQCVEKTMRQELDAIMIPEVRVGSGFWADCRALERVTYVGDPMIESARFFRKSVVLALGGFDEGLEAGEDWDLHARLENGKHRIGRVAARIRHFEGDLTLKQLVRKRYHYGKTILHYIRKNPRQARVQYLPIRLNYIRNWRFLAKYPLLSSGMLLMKLVEYVAVLFGILTFITDKVAPFEHKLQQRSTAA